MSSYYPKAEVEIGETLLSAKGLGDRNLLHDIDFFVRKGEILGFAGIAGSGRTELAQALCGFTQLTGGTVELEGRRVRFSSYHEAMEHGWSTCRRTAASTASSWTGASRTTSPCRSWRKTPRWA